MTPASGDKSDTDDSILNDHDEAGASVLGTLGVPASAEEMVAAADAPGAGAGGGAAGLRSRIGAGTVHLYHFLERAEATGAGRPADHPDAEGRRSDSGSLSRTARQRWVVDQPDNPISQPGWIVRGNHSHLLYQFWNRHPHRRPRPGGHLLWLPRELVVRPKERRPITHKDEPLLRRMTECRRTRCQVN